MFHRPSLGFYVVGILLSVSYWVLLRCQVIPYNKSPASSPCVPGPGLNGVQQVFTSVLMGDCDLGGKSGFLTCHVASATVRCVCVCLCTSACARVCVCVVCSYPACIQPQLQLHTHKLLLKMLSRAEGESPALQSQEMQLFAHRGVSVLKEPGVL